MPGILPMKLIRTGSSNQTRIAQACDRCRSKKIRCDGIRPCCTQCANVGFECKTSDKLSRRAFPRGYTESLEERVRCLEAEVKELKDLLDAKEEQIDMLSRIHSFSPYSPPPSSASPANRMRSPSSQYKRPSTVSEATPPPEEDSPDDRFSMPESTTLVSHEKSGEIFVGASSGKAFIDVFKSRVQNAKTTKAVEISSDAFFSKDERDTSTKPNHSKTTMKAPPRMISDLLVTAFFQEYHPLFPVLHRPTFLTLYGNLVDQEVSSPTYPKDDFDIAQLFLVFAIASSQTEARNSAEHDMFNRQWQKSLDALLPNANFETLQCLVLAILYCISVGDYTQLMYYRGLAVGISSRLGLHLCQKKFNLSALKSEMRKRVFWCLYCLDSFSAAMLGVPMLVKEEDTDTDYPADIDDEYVSEKGFLPTLPGDHTKISSSIALFRASRMLSKVLSTIYSTTLTHRQSYKKLQELEDDLDSWKAGLAPHLRLEFTNGMPSTNIIHSRSPLLVLAYHYIRVLIHRPTVTLDSSKSSGGSVYALAESSKCIFQIVKLLEERKLGFSFCVNKNQTLLLCGFAVLYGSMGASQEGHIMKENGKIVHEIVATLQKGKYPLASSFREIADTLIAKEPAPAASNPSPRRGSKHILSPKVTAAIQDGIQSIRRASSFSQAVSPRDRRKLSTKSNISDSPYRRPNPLGNFANSSRASLPPMEAARLALLEQCGPRASFVADSYIGNIDVFSWANGDCIPPPATVISTPPKSSISTDEWEQIVAAVDQNHGASIYGGMPTGPDHLGLGLMPPAFSSSTSSLSTVTTTKADSPLSNNHLNNTASPTTDFETSSLHGGTSVPWGTDSWNAPHALNPTATSVSSVSNFGDDEPGSYFETDSSQPFLPNLVGIGSGGLNCDWGL